jgi:hypothetical protein
MNTWTTKIFSRGLLFLAVAGLAAAARAADDNRLLFEAVCDAGTASDDGCDECPAAMSAEEGALLFVQRLDGSFSRAGATDALLIMKGCGEGRVESDWLVLVGRTKEGWKKNFQVHFNDRYRLHGALTMSGGRQGVLDSFFRGLLTGGGSATAVGWTIYSSSGVERSDPLVSFGSNDLSCGDERGRLYSALLSKAATQTSPGPGARVDVELGEGRIKPKDCAAVAAARARFRRSSIALTVDLRGESLQPSETTARFLKRLEKDFPPFQ